MPKKKEVRKSNHRWFSIIEEKKRNNAHGQKNEHELMPQKKKKCAYYLNRYT
jgi:hypothetical protein